MGFDASNARSALRSCDGNVEQAAELLLASSSGSGTTAQAPSVSPGQGAAATNNNALDYAIQESLQTEEARQIEKAMQASNRPVRSRQSAAALRAGQAAARRAAPEAPGIKSHQKASIPDHPDLKIPAKLQDKSKEEQLLRCADRMKTFPLAVDTLYVALTALRKDPGNAKFLSIDKTNAGFKRSLEGVPGAEAMLIAMNYRSQGPHKLVLPRDQIDLALLYLGISALDKTRETREYKDGKQKIAFGKQVQELWKLGDTSEVEAVRRADFQSKCPTEPSGGRGALMQVKIVDETFRRRFDGDDVLQDVLHWLGGHNSTLFEKLVAREWLLVDVNRYPIAPIDINENKGKTLQYIGCWPSGRLEIVPPTEELIKAGR